MSRAIKSWKENPVKKRSRGVRCMPMKNRKGSQVKPAAHAKTVREDDGVIRE
jgi:hypothetical protein